MWRSSFQEKLKTWFYTSEEEAKGDVLISSIPGGSRPASTCRLIRSQNLRQQLGMYALKSLPERNWEMGIFVCSPLC